MDEHFHLDPSTVVSGHVAEPTEWSARLGHTVTWIVFIGAALFVALLLVALGIWAVSAAL